MNPLGIYSAWKPQFRQYLGKNILKLKKKLFLTKSALQLLSKQLPNMGNFLF